ncbi:hypothetical protein DICPUDRAFT_14626, partial [Dictyostelium purpureum]
INIINFLKNIFKENNSNNSNINHEINIEQNQLLVSSLFLLTPNLNKNNILKEIFNYLNNNENNNNNNFHIFLLSIVYSIIKYNNNNNNNIDNNEIIYNIIKFYSNQIINENNINNNSVNENNIKIISKLISKIQNLIFNNEIYLMINKLIDGVNNNNSNSNKFGLQLVNGILNDGDISIKDKERMCIEFYPTLIPTVIENLENSTIINQYTKQQSLFILSKLLLDKENVEIISKNEKLLNLYYGSWLQLLWSAIIKQKDINEKLKLCFFFHQCYFDCLIFNLKSKKLNDEGTFNIIKKVDYWNILFESLIDKDSLPRKQAIHLLKNTVSLPSMLWKESLPKGWEQKQWNLFFSLYECFDETKSHLFVPVWVQIHNLINASNERDNFTHFKEPSSIYFWIRILYFRGFNHINVNIKKRVIVDALADQSILKHLHQIDFVEFQQPLLKALDTFEITVNYESERSKDLVERLSNYLKVTVKSNLELEQLLQFISKSTQEVKTILLFTSILSKQALESHLSASSNILESIRYILVSHPIQNSNTQLYQNMFELLKSLDISNEQLSFSQISKIISMIPRELIDNDFKNHWMKSKGNWFIINLKEATEKTITSESNTLSNNSSSSSFENEKENLIALSRVLSICSNAEIQDYIENTIIPYINDSEKVNRDQQMKLLLLINSILEELQEKHWIKVSNQIEPIKFTLIKLIKQYIVEKTYTQDNYNTTLTKEESEKIIDQFKMFEMAIKLIKKLPHSAEFTQLSNDMKNYILNDSTSLDLKGITVVLLVWIQCKQQPFHQPQQPIDPTNTNNINNEVLFNKLLTLEPKYKFDSTISYILPKFIQFKWTSIHSILFSFASNTKYSQEMTFDLALSALDNATGSTLIPIFECLSIVISSPSSTEILNNEHLMEQLFKQSYLAFSDSNRKPNNLCIAFSNLLFNSILFENSVTIPLVKSYLKQTLEDLGGSVRISCGLLSHCCAIWSKKINTLPIFLNEIIDLCLLTSEDKLVLEDSNENNEEQSSDSFKLFNNHGYIIRWFVSQLTSNECKPFVETLILELLQLNFKSEFSKREYSQHSRTNKMKCKLWRTLCSLTHIIQFNQDNIELYEKISNLMWNTLELKNHSNVRYLIQLFIINILVKSPNIKETNQKLVTKMEDSINSDYQISASLIIISSTFLYYLLNNYQDSYEQMVINLFKTLLPWSTDFHHAVRTTSQLAIYTIINKKFKILEQFNESELIKSIFNYLEINKIQKRLREKQTLFVESDDPLKKTLAENILSDNSIGNTGGDDEDDEGESNKQQQEDDDYSNLSVIDDAIIPMSLLDISKKLIKDFQVSFQNNQNQHSAAVPQPTTEQKEHIQINNSNDDEDDEILDFQRRITPWQWINKLEEHHQINNTNNSNNNNNKKNKRQSMIIVGTFIENTPNLAGLIRTCEIFNVEEVAIPNLKLLNDPQFQRVSVSAEKLVPIIEITKPNLLDYLKLKKKEGYSILGVEQTSQSKNLSSFQFPEKCLLLLGQEQNGIPANYLTIVDYCVEIPQLGQIRSLNVHVSASIVIWEYTQQQILQQQK